MLPSDATWELKALGAPSTAGCLPGPDRNQPKEAGLKLPSTPPGGSLHSVHCPWRAAGHNVFPYKLILMKWP